MCPNFKPSLLVWYNCIIMSAKLYISRGGFTLIELLVVISIVSLLSSVVLSSLNGARKKVSSNKTLSNATGYRTAIELYRADNTGYPNPGTANQYYCIGDYSTNACGYETIGQPGNYFENTTLQNALRDYIALPKNDPVPYAIGGGTWYANGPVYSCTNITGGVCTAAKMWWWTTPESSCLGGATTDEISPLSYNPALPYHRLCIYTFQ